MSLPLPLLAHFLPRVYVCVCVVAGSSSGRVAGPGLGEEQVAVLRHHAAVCWLRNDCTILPGEEAAHRTDV